MTNEHSNRSRTSRACLTNIIGRDLPRVRRSRRRPWGTTIEALRRRQEIIHWVFPWRGDPWLWTVPAAEATHGRDEVVCGSNGDGNHRLLDEAGKWNAAAELFRMGIRLWHRILFAKANRNRNSNSRNPNQTAGRSKTACRRKPRVWGAVTLQRTTPACSCSERMKCDMVAWMQFASCRRMKVHV